MTEQVEWHDVQALVLRPFSHWKESAHLLMRITDPDRARAWLRTALETDIRSADDLYTPFHHGDPGINPVAARPIHMNVAFTVDGLREMGLCKTDLATFEPAFVEGMAPEPDYRPEARWDKRQTTTRRAGVLGDLGVNVSRRWLWGGTKPLPEDQTTLPSEFVERGRAEAFREEDRALQADVHLMVMLFARTRTMIDIALARMRHADTGMAFAVDPDRLFESAGQRTRLSDTEHFGFADGVSQPIIRGTPRARTRTAEELRHDGIEPGEFVLGYKDERGTRMAPPSVAARPGADSLVPVEGAGGAAEVRRQFGRNGTYLVARQLRQNVGAFDALVQKIAREFAYPTTSPIADGCSDIPGEGEDCIDGTTAQQRERAAALLVGRAKDGAPLILHPRKRKTTDVLPMHKGAEYSNAFGYQHSDPSGMLCPLGSHVRRTNPRDSLKPDPKTSLALSKQHRILRRGRIYGKFVPDEGFTRARDHDDDDRGLFFICLNADIEGQFEFIQHTWINNPTFGDLTNERDALLATLEDSKVSFPGTPHTRWVTREEPLVTVVGGAYFFLPSLSALRCLATPPDAKDQPDGTARDGN